MYAKVRMGKLRLYGGLKLVHAGPENVNKEVKQDRQGGSRLGSVRGRASDRTLLKTTI